jgi:hypothetical protein
LTDVRGDGVQGHCRGRVGTLDIQLGQKGDNGLARLLPGRGGIGLESPDRPDVLVLVLIVRLLSLVQGPKSLDQSPLL